MNRETERGIYYKLVKKINLKGIKELKRHGHYININVFGGYVLRLDTWSNAIVVFNCDKIDRHLGIDFGGFECDIFWTKYWSAHI